MTQTLDSIRARVGLILEGRPFFLSSTITGGTTTTLADAIKLKVSTRGSGYRYVLRTSVLTSDRERDVASYDNATGTLTVTPAYLVAPTNGNAYEAWSSYQPSAIEELTNLALARLPIIEEIDVTGVDAQRQYTLASYAAWLVDPRQILKVTLRDGSSANAYQYLGMAPPPITSDEGALTMNLIEQLLGGSDILRFTAVRNVASLATLSAGTDTVPLSSDPSVLDWIAWEVALMAVTTPLSTRMGADSQAGRSLGKAAIEEQVQKYRAKYTPQVPYRLFESSEPPWGPNAVGL